MEVGQAEMKTELDLFSGSTGTAKAQYSSGG